MPLTYEPRAAPWEHLLVEKIFQKVRQSVVNNCNDKVEVILR